MDVVAGNAHVMPAPSVLVQLLLEQWNEERAMIMTIVATCQSHDRRQWQQTATQWHTHHLKGATALPAFPYCNCTGSIYMHKSIHSDCT